MDRVGALEDPNDSASTKIYKLRLGESVYIDRLGTLTLLEVNPESISSGGMLGWAYRVNVDFDPGVSECSIGDSCSR